MHTAQVVIMHQCVRSHFVVHDSVQQFKALSLKILSTFQRIHMGMCLSKTFAAIPSVTDANSPNKHAHTHLRQKVHMHTHLHTRVPSRNLSHACSLNFSLAVSSPLSFSLFLACSLRFSNTHANQIRRTSFHPLFPFLPRIQYHTPELRCICACSHDKPLSTCSNCIRASCSFTLGLQRVVSKALPPPPLPSTTTLPCASQARP